MTNSTPVKDMSYFMPNRDDVAIRVLCGAQEDTKSASLFLHRARRTNGSRAVVDGAAAPFHVGAQAKTVSPLLFGCLSNL